MRRFLPIFALILLAAARPGFAQATRAGTALSVEDALKAHADGTIPAFTRLVEEAIRQELAQKKFSESAMVRMGTLRAFALRAPAKLGSPEDLKTLEWVMRHATLGPLLLTAISERDNAARVISVMTALRANHARAVEQYPDLAVATCVVWDSPNREGQTPEQAVREGCDVFAHLTQNARVMRVDASALPWPVLVYLVDSHVTAAERTWALGSYRLPSEPGRAYFSVRYDWEGFESGEFRGGNDRTSYTLANILRFGGVCKDQAHFAAEVCRAYGIPATVCTGQSAEGEGFHAWVGLLRAGRNRAAWDFRTARYAEHGFWSGTVVDPQTGQKFSDGEVAMLAEWCGVTRDRRLLSLALTQSLDLVAEPRRIAMSETAIESAPGNAQAWLALANLCMRPETPVATLQEVSDVVKRFAVGRYDEFAFKFFMMLVSGRSPEEQLATLDRAMKLFPRRPDLLAELALRKGDVLSKQNKPVDALRLYQKVLDDSLEFGPLVLDAMGRIDAMLRSAGKTADLVQRYRAAWTRMAVPKASGYAWTTPWYIMGDRYAKALEESGDKTAAQNVRRKIFERDLSGRGK